MSNLFTSEKSVDFWVWVNPHDWITRQQIIESGGFTAGGMLQDIKMNLPFLPNPEYKRDITPFQLNLTRNYRTEYNLELTREQFFPKYPSRMNAVFLFISEDEAQKYKELHADHVYGRILKKCHSVVIPCMYSLHDCSWVDFLRITSSIDLKSLENANKAYWSGNKAQDYKLQSMGGETWIQEACFEALFLGRVEFYDRNI